MSAPTKPKVSAAASELEIKNVLLVDDDEGMANTLKLLLESHNFIVTTASDGASALREVVAFDFDVIICDMLMPKMAGDLFYYGVKKVKPHLTSRFLFITGHGENPKIDLFFKSIDAHAIYKPVLTDELVRMISLVLQRPQGLTRSGVATAVAK